MEVKPGYIYHIKDEFFEKVNGKGLMLNHETGHSRPTYFMIKDKNLLWFIPLSSRTEKYEPIINKKIKKYGNCRSIMIDEIAGEKVVILIQNAFPTLEKYIDHPHVENGTELKVVNTLKRKILSNFNYLISLKRRGNNLFFTDIDRIKQIMLEEIKNS